MKGIRAIKLVGYPNLASAVQIQAVFDEAPDSVRIQIKDVGNTVVVNNQAMTGDSGGLYYYYDYQQVDGNNYGDYKLLIKAVYGALTVYKDYIFPVTDPDETTSGGF